MIFTDGSVNTRSNIGYGACLVISDPDTPLDILKTLITVKRFENTSSTRLELQTLLWALDGLHRSDFKVIIYTDSQTIMGLPERRLGLEKNAYLSKKNKPLSHGDLYQEFFKRMDMMDWELIKVKGHNPSNRKDNIDRIFTLVDRASRTALRENNETALFPADR